MMMQLPLRKLPGCGYSTCAKIKSELGCEHICGVVDTSRDKDAHAFYHGRRIDWHSWLLKYNIQ